MSGSGGILPRDSSLPDHVPSLTATLGRLLLISTRNCGGSPGRTRCRWPSNWRCTGGPSTGTCIFLRDRLHSTAGRVQPGPQWLPLHRPVVPASVLRGRTEGELVARSCWRAGARPVPGHALRGRPAAGLQPADGPLPTPSRCNSPTSTRPGGFGRAAGDDRPGVYAEALACAALRRTLAIRFWSASRDRVTQRKSTPTSWSSSARIPSSSPTATARAATLAHVQPAPGPGRVTHRGRLRAAAGLQARGVPRQELPAVRGDKTSHVVLRFSPGVAARRRAAWHPFSTGLVRCPAVRPGVAAPGDRPGGGHAPAGPVLGKDCCCALHNSGGSVARELEGGLREYAWRNTSVRRTSSHGR